MTHVQAMDQDEDADVAAALGRVAQNPAGCHRRGFVRPDGVVVVGSGAQFGSESVTAP